MVKPDRLSLALNGPSTYPPLSSGLGSKLSFKKLRRPTSLPTHGGESTLGRWISWLAGAR
jgi:hypothetical protein